MAYEYSALTNTRKLHVSLLLFRPFLSEAITTVKATSVSEASQSKSLSSKLIDYCIIECVRAAMTSIKTIYDELFSNEWSPVHLSAWYYNVLYLYTAATVLVSLSLNLGVMIADFN